MREGRKKEASRAKQTNKQTNKAKQHSTCTCTPVFVQFIIVINMIIIRVNER